MPRSHLLHCEYMGATLRIDSLFVGATYHFMTLGFAHHHECHMGAMDVALRIMGATFTIAPLLPFLGARADTFGTSAVFERVIRGSVESIDPGPLDLRAAFRPLCLSKATRL